MHLPSAMKAYANHPHSEGHQPSLSRRPMCTLYHRHTCVKLTSSTLRVRSLPPARACSAVRFMDSKRAACVFISRTLAATWSAACSQQGGQGQVHIRQHSPAQQADRQAVDRTEAHRLHSRQQSVVRKQCIGGHIGVAGCAAYNLPRACLRLVTVTSLGERPECGLDRSRAADGTVATAS